jgi:methylmalonyl-CoA/ethylmalonyl-CoA epimerase
MSNATPGITRIGQLALTVRDLPATTAFYRDTLGLRLLFEVPNMSFFDAGNLRLMLGRPESDDAPVANSILYYQVPDIQAAHALLVERGVPSIGAPHRVAKMPDHDLWMAFLRDPEGNTLGLMCEVRAG